MSKQSIYTLAALASAAMPTLQVAGARMSEQYTLDEDALIQTAVITDTVGHQFDVCISTQDAGKQQLQANAAASQALLKAKDPAGLGFQVERAVAFSSGNSNRSATGTTAVLVRKHIDGYALDLHELTDSQLASVGTAIGAIHRLRPQVATKQGYPAFTAEQIRQQLVQWIEQLHRHGQVPSEIIDNWHTVITTTQGLWSFTTCLVHGGFSSGDMLFSSTGLQAIYHWANMQVNDPARDLAWTFDTLDARQRTIVFSAYARLVGSHLDDMIMLRAVLWRQMDQVGAFMKALDRADNNAIMLYKSRMQELAHQIAMRSRNVNDPTRQPLQAPSRNASARSSVESRNITHSSDQSSDNAELSSDHNSADSTHSQYESHRDAHTNAGTEQRNNALSTPTLAAQGPVIGERLTDEPSLADAARRLHANAHSHTAGGQDVVDAERAETTTGASSATIVLHPDGRTAANDREQHNTHGDSDTHMPVASSRSHTSADVADQLHDAEAPTEVIPKNHPVGIERTDKHPTGYISLVAEHATNTIVGSAQSNSDVDNDSESDTALRTSADTESSTGADISADADAASHTTTRSNAGIDADSQVEPDSAESPQQSETPPSADK